MGDIPIIILYTCTLYAAQWLKFNVPAVHGPCSPQYRSIHIYMYLKLFSDSATISLYETNHNNNSLYSFSFSTEFFNYSSY